MLTFGNSGSMGNPGGGMSYGMPLPSSSLALDDSFLAGSEDTGGLSEAARRVHPSGAPAFSCDPIPHPIALKNISAVLMYVDRQRSTAHTRTLSTLSLHVGNFTPLLVMMLLSPGRFSVLGLDSAGGWQGNLEGLRPSTVRGRVLSCTHVATGGGTMHGGVGGFKQRPMSTSNSASVGLARRGAGSGGAHHGSPPLWPFEAGNGGVHHGGGGLPGEHGALHGVQLGASPLPFGSQHSNLPFDQVPSLSYYDDIERCP